MTAIVQENFRIQHSRSSEIGIKSFWKFKVPSEYDKCAVEVLFIYVYYECMYINLYLKEGKKGVKS